jgi:hypothetical protein
MRAKTLPQPATDATESRRDTQPVAPEVRKQSVPSRTLRTYRGPTLYASDIR